MAGTSTRAARNRCRIGLIINPIAGMGGAVALKGTDGELAARAAELGAVPRANERALAALSAMAPVAGDVDWLTVAGAMGGDSLETAGFAANVVYEPGRADTTAGDTRQAAELMVEHGADLVLFSGGDGTAHDIFASVGQRVPILGIPAGVKMHSAVFAVSPRAAGEAVRSFVDQHGDGRRIDDAEIMDRPDDEASPELLGYAKTPAMPQFIAHGKSAAAVGSVEGACRQALERIRAESGLVLIGPGTTMRRIKQSLGFDGTLLGVDAVRGGSLAGTDLTAADMLALLERQGEQASVLLVVGVVGGQGFLFGRGNQQLSAEVLERIGHERIVVVSSMEKLVGLPEQRLWVDTGDEGLDASLEGYVPVLVGDRQVAQIAVRAASRAETAEAPVAGFSPAVQNG